MKHSLWLASGLASLSALTACGGDFPPSSRIDGLRLLAVAADHPAAAPGTVVTLSALYDDTAQRTLSWGFARCDSQTSSAAVDCLRALDVASLVITHDVPAYTLTMPEPAATAQRDSSVGIAVIVCPGQIVPGDTDGIPLTCQAAGKTLPLDDFEIGVKRVYYGANDNQNPSISSVTWDGDPWLETDIPEVTPCADNSDDVTRCDLKRRHTIVVNAPDVAERYVDSLGSTEQEQAVVQFYGTGGSFEFDARTPESATTRWVARKEDAGKTLRLYVVVRDSRGGVSWQTRQVAVAAL